MSGSLHSSSKVGATSGLAYRPRDPEQGHAHSSDSNTRFVRSKVPSEVSFSISIPFRIRSVGVLHLCRHLELLSDGGMLSRCKGTVATPAIRSCAWGSSVS